VFVRVIISSIGWNANGNLKNLQIFFHRCVRRHSIAIRPPWYSPATSVDLQDQPERREADRDQQAGKREKKVMPIGAQPMRSLRRILSHASWALPVLSFVPLIASVARTGQHPSGAATDLSVVMIVTGSCCGIIALIGIPWSGDNDWVVAAVGLAFSIFIFLVAAYGLR
jgi:hypothetical protein